MPDNIQNNSNSNQGNIMKELSDIKTSLAVNTTETSNIKDSVNEVKLDVKEMKKNYITQEQHKELVESHADHESRIRENEKGITKIMTYGSALVIFIGILEFIISKFYIK
jgi:hypothetical protein